jgi:hypothetical protein
MFFKEIISVYNDNHTKLINTEYSVTVCWDSRVKEKYTRLSRFNNDSLFGDDRQEYQEKTKS